MPLVCSTAGVNLNVDANIHSVLVLSCLSTAFSWNAICFKWISSISLKVLYTLWNISNSVLFCGFHIYAFIYLFFCALVPDCVLKSFLCVTWTAQSLIVVQHPVLPNCHAVVLTWSGLQLQPFLVDLHEQYVKWYVQTKYCVSSCFWKHNCIEKILYINQGVWLQIISIFHFPCLVLFITVTSSRERNVVCPRKRRWPESPPVKLSPSP